MRGDFSRVTSQRRSAHRQVLLQQGRVLLDADFNEQGAISADGLRRLTRDLLGRHAGPAGALGFAIGKLKNSFTIAWGRYYVDGWLAVNEPLPSDDVDAPPLYEQQAGFPFPGSVEEPDRRKLYFLYLDVWERSVSWLEDATIREPALGGPDTSVRREVVWQVRVVPRPADFADSEAATAWLTEHVARHRPGSADAGPQMPLMRAWVDPADDSDDTPCVADPLGGYSGLENQLYRVEIHAAPDEADQAETGELTFKWSRDNGSVVAALTGHAGDVLTVDGVRDTAHGFSAGQWVEITDTLAELRGLPGVMVKLRGVEPGKLTYDPASVAGGISALDDLLHPVVRRWDHGRREGEALLDGAIVLQEDEDFQLERGIKVRFPKQEPGAANPRRYATGDHWTFAARTATADIEWPYTLQPASGQPEPVKEYLARVPDGIEHAYAPLAHGAMQGGPGLKSLQRTINELWTAV